jgi:predicted NBD/HSP70 family sugar kinase
MYLAVDIGGTKTLVAVFDDEGKIIEQARFETAAEYSNFLSDLKNNITSLSTKNFTAACVAVPGRLDREKGLGLGYGNLNWGVVHIRDDIEALLNCHVIIENDAKLAGLSEALLIKNEFKIVLYVTIGTGIGTALIVNGVIDVGLANSEGGQIWLDYHGKRVQWEDIASGKAIVERFGKRASDIHDKETWEIIANDIALGLIDLIAMVQPQVIVLGGGVDTNFDDFYALLTEALKKYETSLVPIPPIRQAKRPEEAVIYGCLELARGLNADPA